MNTERPRRDFIKRRNRQHHLHHNSSLGGELIADSSALAHKPRMSTDGSSSASGPRQRPGQQSPFFTDSCIHRQSGFARREVPCRQSWLCKSRRVFADVNLRSQLMSERSLHQQAAPPSSSSARTKKKDDHPDRILTKPIWSPPKRAASVMDMKSLITRGKDERALAAELPPGGAGLPAGRVSCRSSVPSYTGGLAAPRPGPPPT
jgi:hypothetical protein